MEAWTSRVSGVKPTGTQTCARVPCEDAPHAEKMPANGGFVKSHGSSYQVRDELIATNHVLAFQAAGRLFAPAGSVKAGAVLGSWRFSRDRT